MRVAAIVLVSLVAGVGVVTGDAGGRRRMPVYDYTSAAWQPFVAETVEAFNHVLPDGAPRLHYIPMGALPCDQLPTTGRPRAVTVCVDPDARLDPYAGWAAYALGKKGTGIRRGLVRLNPAFDPSGRIICHEFMHVLAAAPDGNTRVGADSCIWGRSPTVGSEDAAFLRSFYRKHRR